MKNNRDQNMPDNDHQEINRKRKNNNNHDQSFQIPRRFSSDLEDSGAVDREYLTLSLSYHPSSPVKHSSTPPPPPPPPPPLPSMSFLQPVFSQPTSPLTQNFYAPPPSYTNNAAPLTTLTSRPAMVYRDAGPSRTTRSRRNPSQTPREGKSETIPVPYPWATNKRATVHSLNHLLSEQIFTIKGEVQCKKCEKQYEMEYDLKEKFVQVGSFIAKNKSAMHDRAPGVWMNPVLPTCKFCDQENSVKPVISEKKKSINWLFLLLGQMLGCCTLEQLKYFCKHTKNHRTGAKDRVLYLTYLGLCKQLDPTGPFHR